METVSGGACTAPSVESATVGDAFAVAQAEHNEAMAVPAVSDAATVAEPASTGPHDAVRQPSEAPGAATVELGTAQHASVPSNAITTTTPLQPAAADRPQRARALYDFAAEGPGELALCAGSEMTVIHVMDDGWARVEYDGRQGLCPLSYLEMLDTGTKHGTEDAVVSAPADAAIATGALVVAVADYVSDYPGDLCVRAGDRVVIVDASDPVWLRGQLEGGDRSGVFPRSYVAIAQPTGQSSSDAGPVAVGQASERDAEPSAPE